MRARVEKVDVLGWTKSASMLYRIKKSTLSNYDGGMNYYTSKDQLDQGPTYKITQKI